MICFEVYKATCSASNKAYIGFTQIGAKNRWSQHIAEAGKLRSKGGSAICAAIRKYGAQSFTFEVIFIGRTRKEAAEKEQELIAFYRTLSPNGYNLTSGGESGFKLAEESKKKVSAALKGHPVSALTRKKLSNKFKGRPAPHARKPMAAETRAKLSLVKLGKNFLTPEGRERMRQCGRKSVGRLLTPEAKARAVAGRTGKLKGPRTLEVRAKISLALKGRGKGRKLSEATRLKMSNAQRGRTFSDAHKDALRKAAIGRCLSKETKLKISLARKSRKFFFADKEQTLTA